MGSLIVMFGPIKRTNWALLINTKGNVDEQITGRMKNMPISAFLFPSLSLILQNTQIHTLSSFPIQNIPGSYNSLLTCPGLMKKLTQKC